MGSYLWSWQRAQVKVSAIQVDPVVSTLSITVSTNHSSSILPPSPLSRWLRLKPVAITWSSDGLGKRSPANCSMVNWSKGRLRLNAPINHSRHIQISRLPSLWNPLLSAYRAKSNHSRAIRSPKCFDSNRRSSCCSYADSESSVKNESISLTVGGRPIRSRLARRNKVSLSAGWFRVIPSLCNFLKINESTGCSATPVGTSGLIGFSKDQCFS